MKKLLKTFKFVIIYIAIVSTIVFTSCESKAFATQNTVPQIITQTEQKNPNDKTLTTIPEKNAYNITHMKKTGFKYGLLKFFSAILGVLISSLAIFFGLKLYKKFILKNNSNLDNIDYDKSLESPKDFKEAINLFLDKTDKE